ncbi:hypothetical protein [Amycolatopsis tucumanensis]|uniref:Uncharacterized protein n=1 Tax=Amycolatopsis tucumanensis TaxID=401106 RepID=A0ABP7JWF5_9PSEU|nr:hypothetical protein [Amycolatopsis tucumanensis]MCF6428500.1 hypothetical protein [Amycolatopsis tucumanensis]
MTQPHDHQRHTHDPTGQRGSTSPQGHGGHKGHGLMMIACCIPMLAIAIVLVATGVISAGWLVFAAICTVMMALMMRGMGHGENR